MNAYVNDVPIPELIKKLDAHMVSLGYTASTLRHHRQAWNALKNLALAEGATHFSKELGFKLLREHYKIDPYESNLSEYKSVVRRSVMLLLEFQISGTIAKRLPKRDYDIPGGFNAAGNRFIEYLEGSNFAPGTIYNYRMYIFRAISFFINHGTSSFENLNNDLINLYMKTFAGYIKPGTGGAAAHRSRYVRYAATRDGVEKLAPDKADLPATKKQQAMVERLVRDFPMSRGMFEYEDYRSSPTRAAASEFITRAIEDNYDQVAKRENYISYIAQRPRAERVGSHGLFSGTDDPLALSKIAEEVADHPGSVWLPIISLRREDAARLGYDNAERWRTFLRSYATELAEAMKIPWDQFRWYAAFHDEGHHPHVHMVCYSADGKSGFLTKEGIAQIKSGLAKEIFRQDLTEVYQRQTQRRDELVHESDEVMRKLIQQMRSGTLDNPRIEQLTGELAQRLKRATGKKQYGYLKAPVKAIVDEIVDELAKDPRIAAAYDLWYQLREEVLRTYKDDLPQRLPLSQQKEFKRIKNLVIEEAVRLGEYTEVFAPADTQESDQAGKDAAPVLEDEPQNTDAQAEANEPPHVDRRSPKAKYWAANRILTNISSKPEQISQAVDWLTQSAEAGLDYAQYALGKLYLDGGPVEQNTTQAVIWFSQAAEQGNQYAMYALGKLHQEIKNFPAALHWFQQSANQGNQFAQYRLGKLLLSGDGIPKDVESAVRRLTESAEQGNQYAQYALGKLYLLGQEVPQDRETAVRWFTQSAEQGNQYARYFLDHMNDMPSLFGSATQFLHHMGRIFQEQAPPPSGGITLVDGKLRRKIKEKKIAMGHKPDDHEEQTQQFR